MQNLDDKDALDPLKADGVLPDDGESELLDPQASASEVALRISLLGKLVIPPVVR
jgi:hypothetical protein